MALDLAEFLRNYVADGVGVNAEPATEATLVADLIADGMSVLDLGGGAASFAEDLVSRGCTVESISLTDIEHAAPAAASYDVVLLSDVLGFVREPEKLLQDCRSLLNPKGFIVASVANFGYGAVRLAMLAGSFEKLEYEQQKNPRLHFFSAALLSDLFTRSGYRYDEVLRLSASWDDAAADPRHAHVDDVLVGHLKRDPENTTLMFVVKASPILRVVAQPAPVQPALDALQAELAATRAELRTAADLIAQLKEAGRALQHQNGELRRARPLAEVDEAQSLRTELAAAREVQAELTRRIQRLGDEIAELRRTAEQRAREAETVQAALDESLRNLSAVTTSRDELVGRLHAMDSAMAELKLQAASRADDSARKIQALQDSFVLQVKRADEAESAKSELAKQIDQVRKQMAATLERAEKAERQLLTMTNGLLDSTAQEIQKLSDLVNIVQTSRFWKLKTLAGRLLGR